jgi:hypothetical protein
VLLQAEAELDLARTVAQQQEQHKNTDTASTHNSSLALPAMKHLDIARQPSRLLQCCTARLPLRSVLPSFSS